MEVRLSNQLPVYPSFVPGIRRAPDRGYSLTPAQTETALKNALRYIPEELHEVLAPEFMEELMTRGRIYGYRYRPEGDLKAKPVDQYKGQCLEGKAFQVMIDNNLSFDIALSIRTGHVWRNRAGLPELDAVSPDQAISRNTDERADTRDRVRTSVGTVPFQAGCTPCDYYQFHDGRPVRQSERLAYSRPDGCR